MPDRPGSRKAKVHECFDQKGADIALTRGLELGAGWSTSSASRAMSSASTQKIWPRVRARAYRAKVWITFPLFHRY